MKWNYNYLILQGADIIGFIPFAYRETLNDMNELEKYFETFPLTTLARSSRIWHAPVALIETQNIYEKKVSGHT